MDYLKDINKKDIDYILCRPDKKEIEIIKDIVFSYKDLYRDMGELSFEVPYKVEDKQTHKSIDNELIKLIKDKYLICRFDKEKNIKKYYVIVERNEIEDYQANKKNMQIKCRTLDYNLADINFPTIQGTYQLYKDAEDTVHTGDGIVNVIEEATNWKVGYISDKAKDNFIINLETNIPNLTDKRNGKTIYPLKVYNYNGDGIINENNFATIFDKNGNIETNIFDTVKIVSQYMQRERKYRIFDINNKKIINVIKEEIEPAFDVVFFFDTDREEIIILSRDEVGKNVKIKRKQRVTERYVLDCDRDSKVINSIAYTNYNGNNVINNNEFCKINSGEKDLNNNSDVEVQDENVYLHKDYDEIDNQNPNIVTKESEISTQAEEEIYLYLSDRKYLKQLNKKSVSEKIVTRLHIYGRDNMTISDLNPLGTDYLEDFFFYRNSEYMDKAFMDAFDKYDTLLVEKQIEFERLLKEKVDLEKVKSEIKTQLNTLNTELTIAKNERDSEIIKGVNNIEEFTLKVRDVERRIEEKKKELELIDSQIKVISEQIRENANSIQKENNFTKEQLNTINRVFLVEDTWTNDNYFDKKELFEAGEKALKQVSTPPLEFTIESADILSNDKFKEDADKLEVGNVVNMVIANDNLDIKLRIIEISGSNNKDKNDLKITVSNIDEKIDARRQLSRTLGQMQNAKNVILNNKYKLDVAETTSKTVNELVNSDLDTAKNAVLAGQNQNIRMDNHGIELKNITDDKKQLRMINDTIAMTDDGWLTAKTAITPEGVIAERLIGKILIGEKLLIQNSNNSFRIDDTGIWIKSNAFIVEGGIPDEMIPSAKNWNKIEGNMKNYIDLQTEDLNKGLTSLNNAVDMFSSDEFITVSESKTLEQELIKVKAESAQFIQFARDLSITTELDNYIKAIDGLELELRQWVGLPSYPVKILEVNRLKVTKLFEAVESTKSILTNKISNTLATNAENKAKEYSDKQIEQVNTSLNGLNDDINKFSDDGFITKDEASNLKNQLLQVKAESQDFINLGTSLGVATYVANYSNALTTLETLLNNYIDKTNYPLTIDLIARHSIFDSFENVQKYKSELINKINQKIGDNALEGSKTYTNSQFKVLDKEISSRVKTVDFDNTVSSINERVEVAEQKMTDNNINLKVSYDNLHKQTKLTETFDITVARNQPAINPLMSLNYNGGGVFANNTLINVVNENKELNKLADIEIQNNKIYRFTDGMSEAIDKANSEIDMLKNDITLKVSADTFNSQISTVNQKIGQAETNARTYTESQVKILNDNINLKVSKDYVDNSISGKANKDTLISEINMSPESIKLKADKIDLTGLVTISSLQQAGTVAINGSNVKIGGSGGDGVLTTKDAYDNEIVKIDKEGICVTVFPDTGRPEEGGIPQPFRINFSNGVDLLKIGADNYIEFHGAINVTTGTDYVSMSPWGFSFSNGAHINASKYRGLVDINDVAIGNGTELNHMQNINYRLGLSGVKIHNGQSDGGYGPIYGSTKNAITLTPTYGELVTFADESPNHVQHDSGYGIIGNDGYCIIHLDLKYMETTTTKQGDYLVYLTSYVGCNAELVSTHREYFIVKGNVGKRFNWFTRCEVRGMERLRWNEADVYN